MNRSALVERLERRFGRYAIRGLMNYIVLGMVVVYVASMFVRPFTGFSLASLLAFNKAAILHGQIWRLLTFVFIPTNTSPLFLVLSLYFYWLVGTSLENQWGRFRFNLYYLCGIIGTDIAGMITGYAGNHYLNMSLFLAFALLYPDFELNLFFILAVKVKWLALLDVALLLLDAWGMGWSGWLALIVSFLNVVLFFSRDAVDLGKQAYRRYKWKQNWK